MSQDDAVFVEWGSEAEAVSIRSLVALDALLDDLECLARSTAPFLVVLVGSEGSSLTIGVGSDDSIAQYSDATDEAVAYASVPEPGRKGPPLVFELDGEPNELLAELATPSEAAREAARYFFTQHGRDPRLRWEST